MSLFSSLLRLTSSEKEDFHTEIVGAFFRHNPDILLKWLKSIAVSSNKFQTVVINTQEELDPLENHNDLGSRPDMVIRLLSKERNELIFLESKLGSKQGELQLARYADHLVTEESAYDQRTLIYITRDYEQVEDPKRTGVRFIQRHWSEFYNFIKHLPNKDPLTQELMKFMEENNMSKSNQFSVLDILALTNFSKARKIMDETMGGAIYSKFKAICGENCAVLSDAMSELRKHGRYTIYSNRKINHIGVMLGYWLNDESITDSPSLGVTIEVNPSADCRDEIIKALRVFLQNKKETWGSWDLDNNQVWSGISIERSLQSFISDVDGDHVNAIQRFFQTALIDVNEFIQMNPSLPWSEEIRKIQKFK